MSSSRAKRPRLERALNFGTPAPVSMRLNFGEEAPVASIEEELSHPCASASVKFSEGFNINLATRPKIDPQCTFQKDGKFFKINTKNLNVDSLLKDIPIFDTPPTLDGTYTWIVYDDDKFASSKVTSIFEIGSVHQVLAIRSRPQQIKAAGELTIRNGKKAFNLMSGTFMAPLLNARYRANPNASCTSKMLEEYIIEKMKKKFFGEDATKFDYTFITQPPTDAELDLYTKHGATIEQYNTAEECKTAQSAGRRKRKTLKRRNIKKRNTVRTKRTKRY
jgi:hypothetical protein